MESGKTNFRTEDRLTALRVRHPPAMLSNWWWARLKAAWD